MKLEARAPRLGFNLTLTTKNLIIFLMCLVAVVWFNLDGWMRYPAQNDWLVDHAIRPALNKPGAELWAEPKALSVLDDWRGWDRESAENRLIMDNFVNQLTSKVQGLDGKNGWSSSTDVRTQRWIAIALIFITIAAAWRFVAHLRLRVTANDETVSPRQGLIIPWDKITKVDNTEWRTYGIVEITYTDAAGATATAKFDDYKTQREPLLKILELLSEKAVNAEFIPKEEEPKGQGATAP